MAHLLVEKHLHVLVHNAEIEKQGDNLYVIMKYNNTQKKTESKVNTSKPEWNEEFVFDAVKIGDKKLQMEVWNGGDIIGSCAIQNSNRCGVKTLKTFDLVNNNTLKITGKFFAEVWLEPPDPDSEKVFNANGARVLSYPNSRCRYEGEVLHDLPHGKGMCLYESGRKYEGDWVDGFHEGKGKLTVDAGTVYIGDWKKDNREGWGKQTWSSGHVYEGEWHDDKQHGRGTYTYPSGSRYVGDWVADKQEGKGIYTWPGGQKYVGDWVGDEKHGFGTVTYEDGQVYEGQWRNDKQVGKGTRTYPDGTKYVGENANGMREGMGVLTDRDGNVLYEGLWKAGKPVR